MTTATLHGDWRASNPLVREALDLAREAGLRLEIRDGQGQIIAGTKNISLCAWTPEEVCVWLDGYINGRSV